MHRRRCSTLSASRKKNKPGEAPPKDDDNGDSEQWSNFYTKYSAWTSGSRSDKWRNFKHRHDCRNLPAWFSRVGSGWCPAISKRFHGQQCMLKRNLQERISALPIGIYDWGSERGYTPIDLVIEHKKTDFAGAVAWLTEKTGVEGRGRRR